MMKFGLKHSRKVWCVPLPLSLVCLVLLYAHTIRCCLMLLFLLPSERKGGQGAGNKTPSRDGKRTYYCYLETGAGNRLGLETEETAVLPMHIMQHTMPCAVHRLYIELLSQHACMQARNLSYIARVESILIGEFLARGLCGVYLKLPNNTIARAGENMKLPPPHALLPMSSLCLWRVHRVVVYRDRRYPPT